MIKSVLILCIGNICRSPMAEGLLRERLPKLYVSSAGISALIGQSADSHARELLDASGIDISAHKAQQVVGWMCDQANLVLVMDRDQKRAIEKRYPAAVGKVFRLGEYGDFEVADPYRKGKDAFATCFLAIERGVDDWVRRIKSLNEPMVTP